MEYLDDEDVAFSPFFRDLDGLLLGKEESIEMDSGGGDTDSETGVKVDFWMDISGRPTKSLLDLPQKVQIKILQYAGLLRPCLINISFEQYRMKNNNGSSCNRSPMRATRGSWTTFVDGSCDHPRLPLELLLVSRNIRQGLGPLFFSQNRFSAILYTKADFYMFREATHWGMGHLKYLHLDLGPRDNRFLKLAGGVHRTVLTMWESFCRSAAQHMFSLQDFSLKCRVKDYDVACRIMRETDGFPVLSRCAIHFNHSQDDEIRPILRRAVWRLTDNLGDNKPPFPFECLPKEVQFMILELLLTNRSDPYIPISEWSRGIVTLQERKRQRNSVYPLTCCGTCSSLQAMCFCHARQTAYSSTCSCFTSPLPYFLTSRTFYEDARRIFYSKNVFAFVEEDPDFMMRFMHNTSDSTFKLIRHLAFKFPSVYRTPGKTAHRPEESALVSWGVFRRFIREHFAIPYLSISIVDFGTKNYMPNAIPNRNKYLRKLLKTFADLQGLRDFRVFLADDGPFENEAEKAVLGPAYLVGRSKYKTMPFIGKRYMSGHV
ncbi:hypothetical protein EYZ11_000210 [Aspergillus tanneri]|uniref:F-box domain-containing protein n=1 Tax=Aspergillus tanneri TaxID=1220188 RepID=A0A4S3JXP2_9EURO|nr:uncharacterized protein ATNIH1004_006438 [Aspergillus tanneri]KAA8647741.1 hypothetical protein ATNIH1004_006438 [Aspergillus tanneri]THD00317.1 hypothetical protein EYZ11_000210 [Aspergillus tanneri]